MSDNIKRVIEIDVRASREALQSVKDIAASMKQVEKQAADSKKSLDDFAGGVVGVGKAFLALEAVQKTLAVFKSTVDVLDDLGDNATRAAVSVEFMNKMLYAGKFSDVDSGSIVGAMRKLNLALVEARDKSSDAGKAFDALGINVKGLSGEQAMSLLIAKMTQYADNQDKVAIGEALLGKQYTATANLFAYGAKTAEGYSKEMEELGVKVVPGAAEAASKLNDNLDKLKRVSEALAQQVSGPLVQALADASDGMLKFLKAANDVSFKKEHPFLSFLKDANDQLGKMGGMLGIVKSYLQLKTSGASPVDVDKNMQDWRALERDSRKSEAPSLTAPTPGGDKPKTGKAPKEKTQEWSDLAKGWNPLALRWDEDLSKPDRMSDEEIAAWVKQADQVLGLDQQIEETKTNLKEVKGFLQDVSTAATDAGKEMADAFFDANQSIGESMKSILKTFLKTLARMQLEKAAAGLGDWFGGGGTSPSGVQTGGDGSSWVSSLGSAIGAWFSADGNVFDKPAISVFGEAGPEAVLPLKRGSDGKLGVSAGGGASAPVINAPINVTVNEVTDPNAAAQQAQQVADGIRAVVRSELVTAMRNGGALRR